MITVLYLLLVSLSKGDPTMQYIFARIFLFFSILRRFYLPLGKICLCCAYVSLYNSLLLAFQRVLIFMIIYLFFSKKIQRKSLFFFHPRVLYASLLSSFGEYLTKRSFFLCMFILCIKDLTFLYIE